jgi:4-amino-4-deoxy-L-arabinose transferase-like glycosyltransferase
LYPKYQDISSIQSGKPNPEGYRLVEVPFYNVIHALLFEAFPKFTLEVWGRVLSSVFSLITAIFIYLIGKRFMGKWGGILSAFFFVFIPFNVYYSRVILPDPLAVLFAISGLWFFIKYYDTNKKIFLWLSGMLFALSVLIKPFTIFYSLPMFYLLDQKYGLKKIFNNLLKFWPLFVFSAIIIIPLILWRNWIGRHPEGIPFYEWAFNSDGIRFRPAFFRWIFAERIGKLILGVWGIVPLTIGLLISKKNNSFNLWFFAGTLLYVCVVATANVRHDYYQIFLIPPIALCLAQGTLDLWNNTAFNKIVGKLVAVFSILIMFIVGAYQIKDYYQINHPEILVAGEAVDRLTPKDATVLVPYNGDTAFLYATNRWGWPANDSSVDDIIKKGGDYYVSLTFTDPDTLDVLARFKTIEKTNQYVIVDLHQPISE